MNTCVICGKPISDKATTCGPNCRKTKSRREKRERVTKCDVTPVTPQNDRLAIAIETLVDEMRLRDNNDRDLLLAILSQLQSMQSFPQASSKEVPSPVPFQTPLVIDDDDKPIVKKSSKKVNTSENFTNSIFALLNSD